MALYKMMIANINTRTTKIGAINVIIVAKYGTADTAAVGNNNNASPERTAARNKKILSINLPPFIINI